jgi:hypothetical protein
MSKKYDIKKLKDGWNKDADTGEKYFFIRNPALGLWAVKSRLESDQDEKGSAPKKAKVDSS